jgi:hypothetical protein
MELKEIGPISCARVLGIFYGGIGLIAGAFIGVFALAGAALGHGGHYGNPVLGSLFGVGAIVLLPLLYGTLGMIGGLIVAAFYNAIARWVGGIQVTLQ